MGEMSSSINEVAINCQNESRISESANEKVKAMQSAMQHLDISAKEIGQIIGTINVL